ncbi:MAG: ZIP family metal transporter [Candidatus Accumulibacter sp.]|jgi:zinc and cadmium transporter|nr:ZIP family metal transporter [Accumulibacter sp.]
MLIPLSLQIVLACLLGGVLSIGAAALIMFGLPRRWITLTVSFSTGLLLAMALLRLLPEALEDDLTPHAAFSILLGGILCFFALEKIALWRHAHHESEDSASRGQRTAGDDAQAGSHAHVHDANEGALAILVGDGFHNFTDGLLIAAAFLTDPVLGWNTTLAVIAHEVPQEAGDFAILLGAGWKRARAVFWNVVSSLSAVLGGLVGYYMLDRAHDWIPVILTIAASSFIYVAIADLMPRLKRESSSIGWHSLLLIAGIAVVALSAGHSH